MRKPLNMLLVLGSAAALVMVGSPLAAQAAAGVSVLNVVAVVSYWHVLNDQDAALQQHFYWGLLLLVTLFHGPGKLSLDNLVWRRLDAARA